MPDPLAFLVLAATAGVLTLLLPFAAHRSWLLWTAHRLPRPSLPTEWQGELPEVTVQLPVYDEVHVVERLVDAACSLDYPREKLEVQILDDSDDATSEMAARCARTWRSRGVRVEHVRRGSRNGFKAGALAHGLRRARGQLLLVLDADFVPGPDLIRELLPPFADPEIGMVQARWDHLNEDWSLLTRAQALLLDGHFFFEHGARWRSGRFFNFNGTAGMWRRRCLEDAGGWQADTLTEDLDLSYRAQMKGWRFAFLEGVGVPAELPELVAALEIQQKRWAQGGIQTAVKILPRLLRQDWPRKVKLEAVIHLCGHLAHPLTLLLGLLLYPAAVARRNLGLEHLLWLDLAVLGAATLPFVAYYLAAGRRRGRPWRRLVPSVAAALSVGVGLSAPVSRAVLRGLAGAPDRFDRTPKRGAAAATVYRGVSSRRDSAFKLVMAGTLFVGFVGAAAGGFWASMPFLGLFLSGYLALGLGGLSPPRAGVVEEERPERNPDAQAGPEGLGPRARLLVGGQAPVAEEYEAA